MVKIKEEAKLLEVWTVAQLQLPMMPTRAKHYGSVTSNHGWPNKTLQKCSTTLLKFKVLNWSEINWKPNRLDMALLSLLTGKLLKKSSKPSTGRKFQDLLEHHREYTSWTGLHMEEVLLEPKLTPVEVEADLQWVEWMIWTVEVVAASTAVNSHKVEEEIIKFMLEISMLVLLIQCYFMSSNFTSLQSMRLKSFVIQFLERVKGMVS
mgnify:CR=1 FL=1